MNIEIKTEAQKIWGKLLDALGQLDCFRAKLIGGKVHIYETRCIGLYYTCNHDIVVVAIDPTQLPPDRTDEFFKSRRNQAILKGILGRNVDIVVKDGKLFFKVLTRQAVEPIAA